MTNGHAETARDALSVRAARTTAGRVIPAASSLPAAIVALINRTQIASLAAMATGGHVVTARVSRVVMVTGSRAVTEKVAPVVTVIGSLVVMAKVARNVVMVTGSLVVMARGRRVELAIGSRVGTAKVARSVATVNGNRAAKVTVAHVVMVAGNHMAMVNGGRNDVMVRGARSVATAIGSLVVMARADHGAMVTGSRAVTKDVAGSARAMAAAERVEQVAQTAAASDAPTRKPSASSTPCVQCGNTTMTRTFLKRLPRVTCTQVPEMS